MKVTKDCQGSRFYHLGNTTINFCRLPFREFKIGISSMIYRKDKYTGIWCGLFMIEIKRPVLNNNHQ